MNTIRKVAIIGSGNLATNLALNLYKKDIAIHQIYSRTIENAKFLAEKINAKAIDNLRNLDTGVDLLILSITDDAYGSVLEQIQNIDLPLVHTAGSMPIDIFKNKFKKFGVFYPFQTSTKGREIDFEDVPICIEACNNLFLEQLNDLGQRISRNIYKLNSDKRRKLHLSGIIANNFSNFLFSLSKEYLESEEMEFDMLFPLIQETIEKLKYISPKEAQTGPAVRGNKNVIEKHKDMLKDNSRLQGLYSFLSENIMDYYGKS